MCTVVGGVRVCVREGVCVGFAPDLLRRPRYSHFSETHFHQPEDGPAAQMARRRRASSPGSAAGGGDGSSWGRRRPYG